MEGEWLLSVEGRVCLSVRVAKGECHGVRMLSKLSE